jgi:hypothetical protein
VPGNDAATGPSVGRAVKLFAVDSAERSAWDFMLSHFRD